MSSRNLAALGVAVAAGVASGKEFLEASALGMDYYEDAKTHHCTGVYTFGPMLKEQQKAQEHWRNPGYAAITSNPSSSRS